MSTGKVLMCGVGTSTLDIADLAKFAELFEQEDYKRHSFVNDNYECLSRLRSFFGKDLCQITTDSVQPTEAGSELMQIALDVRESLNKISRLERQPTIGARNEFAATLQPA